MSRLGSIVLMIAFAFAAVSLQGCGCDKDAAKTCMEEKIKEMTTSVSGVTDADKLKAAICKSLKEFVECITGNNCCDEEEDGKKMKDAVNAMVESYKTYGCTDMPKCEGVFNPLLLRQRHSVKISKDPISSSFLEVVRGVLSMVSLGKVPN